MGTYTNDRAREMALTLMQNTSLALLVNDEMYTELRESIQQAIMIANQQGYTEGRKNAQQTIRGALGIEKGPKGNVYYKNY